MIGKAMRAHPHRVSALIRRDEERPQMARRHVGAAARESRRQHYFANLYTLFGSVIEQLLKALNC